MKWSEWLDLWGFDDDDPVDAPLEELEAELDQWFNDTGSSDSDLVQQGWDYDVLSAVECAMPICLIDLETGIPIGRTDYETWLGWVGI